MGEERAGEAGTIAPGTRIGRYVVLHPLGAGGMGLVFAATDPHLERRVALKLVRPAAPADLPAAEAQARLLREAQALARLNHPNVIHVYDVGTEADQVFLAEELVPGVDLDAWLAEKRSVAAILDRFLQAGRGLAAAHAAGLVHRDFKPANVRVGDDGRVRVLDFGLARAIDGAPHEHDPALGLTRPGARVGTPSYMSPEAHAGEPQTPKSDQFAFCVALYRALTGELPFAGHTADEIALEARRGRLRSPPSGARVPGHVAGALAIGLRADPAARFASMDALLAALGRDPTRAARRAVLGGALLLGAGAVAFAVTGRREELCTGGPAKLAGVWDTPARAAAGAAFARSPLPFAAAAGRSVEATLDGYAAGWQRAFTDACAATRLRGEQSEEALDLRMACLEERRQGLASLAALLAQGEAATVERAVASAASLPAIADCADVAALRTPAALPRDAAARGRIEAARARIAGGRVLVSAGRYAEARAAAAAALAGARETGFGPVVAEALLLSAQAAERAGDLAATEALSEEALASAEAAGHDRVRAAVATLLVGVAGRRAKWPDGHSWATRARAIIDRGGGDREAEARLRGTYGWLLAQEGKVAESLAERQAALATWEQLRGADDVEVAEALNALAGAYQNLGRATEAMAHYRRALAIREKLLGSDHPDVAATMARLANVMTNVGDHRQAVSLAERALAIREKTFGGKHREVALGLTTLGGALIAAGETDRAREVLARALALRQELEGPDHPETAMVYFRIGTLELEKERFPEAAAAFERAVAIREKALGAGNRLTGSALQGLGEALHGQKQLDAALVPLGRARAIFDEVHGKDSAVTAGVVVAQAQIALERGDAARAEAMLREALPPLERDVAKSPVTALARYLLAQALWRRPAERPRAIELARQAHAVLGARPGKLGEKVGRWLAARAP